MGDIPVLVLLGVLALFLVSAGIEDARTREIANWKTLAIALLAPVWWWSVGVSPWPGVAMQIGVAAAVFAVFVGAFAIGQMGGGDVKLIGALALWLPAEPLLAAFVSMTLIGGALTIAMIVDGWIRNRASPPRPSIIASIVAAMLAATVAVLAMPGRFDALLAQPLLWLAVLAGVLAGITILLVMFIRAARRRGIVPETPYGVAIAIAGLLAIREPIINQFG